MYIKRLEIIGFKSFAERIKLEFSPGISTVVGPNGCGKSNVIDAVRWVLGEQKYSLLRSKAMDEVIFVGTAQRKPAGLAQVSLTFDNSDGRLPYDLPELTLSRRVYRDGGGQYLLNNHAVRLKDVQELLADTGIGSGALFVLSSTEIDRVLSSNTQERRSILEETAGINKYQLRKKETLQKLASTKENITRLNDILQEVGRQMELSSQQLKKLERYKKVQERVAKLEASLVMLDLEEVASKEKKILEEVGLLERERESVCLDIERIRGEIVAAENSCSQHMTEYEGVREAHQAAELEEEKIRGSSGLIEEKIRQGESAIAEYEESLKRIKDRIETYESGINEHQSLLKKAEESIRRWQASYRDVESDFQEREKAFAFVRGEIEGVRKRSSEVLERKKIIQVRREHTISSLESAREDREKHCEQVGKMTEDLASLDRRLEEAEMEELLLKEKRDAVEEVRSEMESRRNGILQQVQELGKTIFALKETNREAKSEIAVLLREEESFRGFSSAFQAIMSQRAFLPPLTPLHTIIRVEEKYEAAIDVVLGGHFQSIITETRKDAELCIDLLKRERLGRLTFFPMDLERRGGESWKDLPRSLSGIVGWAKDLIDTDFRYRDIVDVVCGRTLVVKNMDSAYRIYEHQKRNRDFIPKMVTLDGDVLEFSGAVTGGRHRTERSQLLSRTRRREELERTLEETTEKLASAEESMKTENGRITAMEKEWQAIAAEADQLDRDIRDTAGQLQVLKTMRERGDADFTRLKASGEELGEKIARNESQLLDLDKEESEMEQLIRDQDEAVSRIEEENRDLVAEMEEVREKREEIRKNLEEAEHRVRTLTERIGSDTAYMEENIQDRRRIEELIESRQNEIKNLRNDLQDTKNRVSILSLRMKSLRIGLETSRKSMKEAEEALSAKQAQLKDREKNRGELEERINEKRISRIELDSRRSYLVDKLREYSAEIRKSINVKGTTREEVTAGIERARKALSSFDTVNFSAEEEYNLHKERYDELKAQIDDLTGASRGLKNIIREMDTASVQALEETLNALNERFGELFQKVFNGGQARIFFSDPDNKLESGIEVEVQPPGKRTTNMNLLSTGEKSLTAVTFLFALLSIKPGPFILLDELDAPLDESNVEKIATLVREFSERSQFLVITHNKKTMEFADTLIGITMEEPGVSKVVSVRFEDVEALAGGV